MPASLFEDGPYRGRLVPVEPRMLAFDEETRGRVSGWLGTGVVDPAKEPRGAVLGMSRTFSCRSCISIWPDSIEA